VVGTNYNFSLKSVGGVGTKTWSETGQLPTQVTLSSTGLLSGAVTDSPSPYAFTAQVKDSATGTSNGQPNTFFQALTLNVNRLSISGVAAANSSTNSIYLKPGDTATATVTVRNDGPATATNVIASSLTVNATAAGSPAGPTPSVTCGAPNPASASISSNSS